MGATGVFVHLRAKSILVRARNSCYLFIPVSRPSATSGISIPTPVPPNPPPVLPVLKRTIMSLVNVDLQAGDPEVRPAFGRCVLSLNSGMAALDDHLPAKC